MLFFFYLTAIAVGEAARITRGIEHPYFPNFRTVYHGHGATSYQNVQIDNGNHIAVPNNYKFEHTAIPTHNVIYPKYADLLVHANHQDLAVEPTVESHADVDYIAEAAAPLDEVTADHVKLEENFILPRYEHYEHSHDYEYH